MKKMLSRLITALFISVPFLALCGGTGGAAENNTYALPAGYTEAFFEQQKESLDQYNQLLEALAVPSMAVHSNGASSGERYAEYYGGAYINQEGKLVVKMTGQDPETLSRMRSWVNGDILTESCQVSYNELMEVIEALSTEIVRLSEQGTVIQSIEDDVESSQVMVRVRDLDAAKEKTIRGVIDRDFMRFENAAEEAVYHEAYGGGRKIVSMADGGSSTLGFAAKSSDRNGFVIAGHAGNFVGERFQCDGKALGSVLRTSYNMDRPTTDAAFILADPGVAVTNELANRGQVWVASPTYVYPQNTVVCMYGMESGLTSGKITSTSMTVSYGSGKYRYDQMKASYSSQEGDSGAPVLYYEGNYGGTKYTLVGLHSGSADGGADFSKYTNIVKELSVEAVVIVFVEENGMRKKGKWLFLLLAADC